MEEAAKKKPRVQGSCGGVGDEKMGGPMHSGTVGKKGALLGGGGGGREDERELG